MNKTTEQMRHWGGKFGQEYTDRNEMSLEEMEQLWVKYFGVTRTAINEEFLKGVDRNARILEVGCNIGNQLLCLQKMGFTNLYAIELQPEAVERAKARTRKINIVQGSAFDIPFKDGFFDLVFTAGVLIHFHPSDLGDVLKEIHRCTRQYIWGTEYWAPDWVEIPYRGERDLLWKTDYAAIYGKTFGDLVLVNEKRLPYLDGTGNTDTVFLLRKRAS
jgi:pseudaminic acid biosynthesis-associated methylase